MMTGSELLARVMRSEQGRFEPSFTLDFPFAQDRRRGRRDMTMNEGIRRLVDKDIIDRTSLK